MWWLFPLAAFLFILEKETGGVWPRIFVFALTTGLFGFLSATGIRTRLALQLAVLFPLAVSLTARIKVDILQRPLLWQDLNFLVSGDLGQTLWHMATGLHLTLAALTLVGVALYLRWLSILDAGRSTSKFRGFSLLALAILIILPLAGKTEVRQINPILKYRHPVSTFVLSAAGLRPQLRPISNTTGAIRHHFKDTENLSPQHPLPDLIAILAESTFDPHARYGLPHTNASRRYFQPSHGTHGALHVETFGGGTWISSFSFLTGISGRAFGDEAMYLPFHLEGKVHDALPALLKKLGYQSIVFFPVEGSFVNAKNFYLSMGFDEFYEPSDLGWDQKYSWRAEDGKFYREILKRIRARNRSTPEKPLFIWLRTVVNHTPHGPHGCYDCSRKIYLERLESSLADFMTFEDQLERLEEGRPYSILHFGDHLPYFVAERETNDLYKTYFSIIGSRNTKKPSLSGFDDLNDPPLDLGFLAGLWLEDLKLPLDSLWQERNRIARDCRGIFLNPEIPACLPATASLHRWMIDERRLDP